MGKSFLGFIRDMLDYKRSEVLPVEKECVGKFLDNIENIKSLKNIGKEKNEYRGFHLNYLMRFVDYALLIWLVFIENFILRLIVVIILIGLLLLEKVFGYFMWRQLLRMFFVIKKELINKNIKLFS